MYLLEIINGPTAEKITFIAALIIAVVWLWREITTLNRKRDEDLKLWKSTYTEVMDKMLTMEKENTRVIERNTIAIEQFTEVLEKVKDKINH